jgi:hypothetical protein
MRAIIIEDEDRSAKRMRSLIETSGRKVTILKCLGSVEESNIWFENNPLPDLIFSSPKPVDCGLFLGNCRLLLTQTTSSQISIFNFKGFCLDIILCLIAFSTRICKAIGINNTFLFSSNWRSTSNESSNLIFKRNQFAVAVFDGITINFA